MGYTTGGGSKGQPLYNSTPQTVADFQAAVDYAAEVGNRRTGTTAQREAATGQAPTGSEFFDETLERNFTKSDNGWADGTGTDAAGWSYHSKYAGKRVYYRFYDSWAGNTFGPAGGSNWSQARASAIAPPSGRNWADFLVSVSVWPQSIAQNSTQSLITGHLSASTGTGTVSLLFQNPTALTVGNTFMTLRASIILTEK